TIYGMGLLVWDEMEKDGEQGIVLQEDLMPSSDTMGLSVVEIQKQFMKIGYQMIEARQVFTIMRDQNILSEANFICLQVLIVVMGTLLTSALGPRGWGAMFLSLIWLECVHIEDSHGQYLWTALIVLGFLPRT
ncbi:hypothetical protein ACJX0J_030209, partial [Zea mays]